jgi:hypothetical protein
VLGGILHVCGGDGNGGYLSGNSGLVSGIISAWGCCCDWVGVVYGCGIVGVVCGHDWLGVFYGGDRLGMVCGYDWLGMVWSYDWLRMVCCCDRLGVVDAKIAAEPTSIEVFLHWTLLVTASRRVNVVSSGATSKFKFFTFSCTMSTLTTAKLTLSIGTSSRMYILG